MGFNADGTWQMGNMNAPVASGFDFNSFAQPSSAPTQIGMNTNFDSMMSQNSQMNAPTSNFGFQPQTQAYGGVDMSLANQSSGSMFDGFLTDGKGGMGWGAQAIGAVSGLAQGYLGFQQLGLAEDQFAFQKNAWQDQFDIQKEDYDRKVSERNARVAANQAASQRVGG